MAAKSCSISRSVRAAVGSSMMRILESTESALATSTICCCATPRLTTLARVSMSMFRLSSRARLSACILA